MHKNYLRDIHISIISREYFFVALNFFDSLVCAHSKHDLLLIRLVSNARKIHIFEFEFKYWVACHLVFTGIRIRIEFPHKDTAIPTARDETWVIIEPLDASDFSNMSFVIEFWRALCCVEFVNTNVVLISTSKKMTSIWKSDLSATFDRNFLESL